MRFEPFEVVVVPFPFTDTTASKRRPALVISSKSFNDNHDQLILAMITTAKNSRWHSDVVLTDWKAAQLAVPCKVRFKLFTLEGSKVVRQLGVLSKADRLAVTSTIGEYLAKN